MIIANLLDMDGCVFNRYYINEFNETYKNLSLLNELPSNTQLHERMQHCLLKHNEPLLEFLKQSQQNQTTEKHILASGSNRQDFKTDQYNAAKWFNGCIDYTGSSFHALKLLHEHFRSTPDHQYNINTLLLSDIYENKDIGHCFEQALTQLNQSEQSNTDNAGVETELYSVFDATKKTLIYTWAHYLYSTTQDHAVPIELNLIDDTGIILEELASCYQKNTQLLPNTVTLNLIHYQGDAVILCNTVQGTGSYHSDYQQRLRKIKTIQETDNTIPKHLNIEETLSQGELIYYFSAAKPVGLLSLPKKHQSPTKDKCLSQQQHINT